MPEHASLLVLHKEDPRRHYRIAEHQADVHMMFPLAHLQEGPVATLQEKRQIMAATTYSMLGIKFPQINAGGKRHYYLGYTEKLRSGKTHRQEGGGGKPEFLCS